MGQKRNQTGSSIEFVGRNSEINQFQRMIVGNGDQRILFLSGIGGIGKSWLLAEFKETLPDDGEFLVSYIDFSRSFTDLMHLVTSISEQLSLVHFENTLSCIEKYKEKLSRLVASGLNIEVPAHISVNVENNVFNNSVGDIVGIKVQGIQLSIPEVEIKRLEQETNELLSISFVSDMNNLLKAKRCVIFFDSYEGIEDTEVGRETETGKYLKDVIFDIVNGEFYKNISFVIARRKDIEWEEHDRRWKDRIIHLPVSYFTKEDCQLYLSKRGVNKKTKVNIVEPLWKLTRGHPQCLALATDLLEELKREGYDFNLAIFEDFKDDFDEKLVTSFLIKKILERIPDEISEVIEKVSVSHFFDAGLIADLIEKKGSAHKILDRVKKFSFTKRAPVFGYTFHDIVRELLIKKWTQDDLIGLKRNHQLAQGYFWGVYKQNNIKVDSQNLLIEAIYHQLNFSPEEGLDTYERLFSSAERSYQTALCESLLKTLDDSVIETPNLEDWRNYYLSRISYIKNDWITAQNNFSKIIEIFGASDKLKAYAYRSMGVLFQAQGNLDNAISSLNRSLGIFRALGDFNGIIQSLNELGTTYRTQIKWNEAISCYEEVINLITKDNIEGKDQELAYAYMYLGVIYTGIGKYDSALRSYEKSLKIYQSLGDLYGQARTFQRFGWMARIRGQFDEALKYHIKALEILRNLGFQHSLAECLHSKGTVHRVRKEFEIAAGHYQEALEIFKKLGATRHIGIIFNDLGALFQAQGKFEDAIDCFNESINIKLGSKQEREASTTLNNLGDIFIELKQWDKAEENLNKSVKIARDIDCPINVVRALTSLCNLNFKRGTAHQIDEYAEEAIWLGERDGYNHYVARIYKIYALAFYSKGYLKECSSALAQSIHSAYKYNINLVSEIIGDFFIEMKNFNNDSIPLFALQESLTREIRDRYSDQPDCGSLINIVAGIWKDYE